MQELAYHGCVMKRPLLRHVLLIALPGLFVLPTLAKDKAKDTPLLTIDWPESGTPALRFTFSKFKSLPGMGPLHGYVMDVTAQNLSSKRIANAQFHVYLFNKDKTRVGEDGIEVSNVGPGESVKFETTVAASDTPVSASLEPITQSAKVVTLTVNSTPQGALLKVDGAEVGETPRMITVGPGHHILTFSKEGFTDGRFPLEIGPNDVSGGTVSFELGNAAFDSVELRDGGVLNGDLVSISGMDLEVRVGGTIQHIDRNKVKRIVLTQREAPTPELPTAAPNP
ncbi:putative PEGA domain protein [Candidatus Sulfotelmatomonas gaucii]|uniref:Putative PEGA domain protein n=1 Tax=Candidatus Sulfuritelmatomonas gaucii TaxID=2043161 RepID=A0A2N9LAK3_9BACT|nr:putative PEGA domain protein [Candidatus Sulfotelmatomonas gaucii]